MKYILSLLTISALMLASCSTDVEINAPYKSTTVVFGLLNPDFNGDNLTNELDTQWIKINRTFMGDGNNNDYAAIRDSSEYKDEDIEVKVLRQLNEDNEVVAEFELTAMTVSNKDVNGIFYGPEQTLYYFVPTSSGLNTGYDYEIYLRFADGHEVSATTNVIDFQGFSWLSPQPGATLAMATDNSLGVSYINPVSIRWYSANNAVTYSAVLRFHYTEILYANSDWTGTPVSVTEKHLDYHVGDVDATVLTSGNLMIKGFDGEGFFGFLRNNLDVNPNAKRIIGHYDAAIGKTLCFDVLMTMSNEALSNYILVNTPSGSVAQERPTYTNIVNGLGLFASRGDRRVLDMPLVGEGQNGILLIGNREALFTAAMLPYNFCDPTPGSPYACD